MNEADIGEDEMMSKKMHGFLLDDIWNQVQNTRNAGQEEYAHDEENVFGNFERINLQELSRDQVLMTYFLKHVDGIMAYVKGHKLQREDVRGRILDAIVYLTLFWGMVDDDEDNGGKHGIREVNGKRRKLH